MSPCDDCSEKITEILKTSAVNLRRLTIVFIRVDTFAKKAKQSQQTLSSTPMHVTKSNAQF